MAILIGVTVPAFATHYFVPGRSPFLSLSALPEPEVAPVLDELAAAGRRGSSSRRFGPRYLALRRATEAKLRRLFQARGGQPLRQHPHYFVLGESPWFRGLYERVDEVRVPLDRLPIESTSVTYPDSVTAMELGTDFGLPSFPRPYHGRVFQLDELHDVVDAYGMPDPTPPFDYDGYWHRPFEHYIEIQLWADPPR